MIINLFRSFDPIIINIPMNLIINSIIVITIIIIKKFINNQYLNFINKITINIIIKINQNNNKSILIVFSSIIIIIIIFNLSNLIPINLSQSSNIILNLNLVLVL